MKFETGDLYGRIRAAVVALFGLAYLLGPAVSAAAAQAAERLDIATASPHELGTRYGQAAGVALICYGLKITPEVEKLKARFSGEQLAAFDLQAKKILAAWEKALRCEGSGGPNECKLSHVWSCQQGLRELGPEGSVIPGLVEQRVK